MSIVILLFLYVQVLESSSFGQNYHKHVKNDDLFTSLEHLQILIDTNQVLTEYFKEIISYQYKKLDQAKE
jgi:hypothetical protein